MTATDISLTLSSLFNLAAYGDSDAREALEYAADCMDVGPMFNSPAASDVPVSATEYPDAGILTGDSGFVLRMEDGSEFQITVVKTKGA